MFEKYNTKYGTRFYKGQKKKFQAALEEDFEALGYKTIVDERKVKMSKVRNIMVGNFKTAKTIIVVPYDTPPHVFWPGYTYYPQEGTHFMRKNFLPTYGPMMMSYAVLLFLVYVVPMWLPAYMQIVLFAISFVYLAGVLAFIIKGFPNAKNATRNTASVAMALDIAQELKNKGQKDCAFVFMDHSAVKSHGPNALTSFMEERQRKTNKIVLYCVGRGATLSVGYGKGHRKECSELLKQYKGSQSVSTRVMDPSDCMNTAMEYLQNAMMISTGDEVDSHFAITRTASGKDTSYDVDIYDGVKDMVVKYITK